MAQSITKNAFYNVLLNIASVIFPLITAPYISRVLEPDGVGLFNFATTYAGYFALVAMLGIPTYGVREVSKARESKEALTKLI
ncbi:MAG: oligosaccharide flippase family protein, partial [Bacteroidaceae bacterium]|nr:oligosaccharide flippase family protein [Bacteroidaceae bacterium]